MFTRPPYESDATADWLVYADWLSEQPDRAHEWRWALKAAEGLRRRGTLRLALVCDYWGQR